MRIWDSHSGKCLEVIKESDSQYDRYYSSFTKKQIFGEWYAKNMDTGITLQYNFLQICRWYREFGNGKVLITGQRICTWFSNHLEFLQLNYGNQLDITFEQAKSVLKNEACESLSRKDK